MRNLLLGLTALQAVSFAADLTVLIHGRDRVPIVTMARAQKTVDAIFSEIGIQVHWTRIGRETASLGSRFLGSERIEVQIEDRFQRTVQAEELGRSRPYAAMGIRVAVGYDPSVFDNHPGLLAHVLAHEVGHVLQRMDRHSAKGIMKATWSKADRYEMERRRLSFSAQDAELISASLQKRLAAAR